MTGTNAVELKGEDEGSERGVRKEEADGKGEEGE
jgi:hypothetical protein